ncbi:ATP-binding cassette domain-containing protein [Paraglaciecola hydrolytica]|uniref:ATP-binding cassette domain-containing protein n=1 Tax=Paraglaciecola hydrolytica TaxID=1799789 RepID=UPI000837BA22|nr:ATP-binding cassette domain-containing protein [Paraglaciecola hydrolytica]
MSSDISISVKNLDFFFGSGELKKQILFDISTDIRAGEIVIVTGPSGSGKTTLLTIVSALRSVNTGSVQIFGKELCGAKSKDLEQVRKNIGFIFQQHNLIAALTALQNVVLGIRISGKYKGSQIEQRAIEYLHLVGLGERIHYLPEQLSGGQKQRVAIARAMAAEPKILMADEPTASLDKQSGRDVVDQMKSMAKEQGSTILLVTHDNRILDVADRIIYLEDGQIASFNEAVIDSSQHMMKVVADTPSERPNNQNESDFDSQYFMVDLSLQSQRILALKSKINPIAFKGVLTNALTDFTTRACEIFDTHGFVLYLANEQAWSVTPLGSSSGQQIGTYPNQGGVVNAVRDLNKSLLITNSFGDKRIEPALDKQFDEAQMIMAVPLRRRSGEVFAVVQCRRLSNKAVFTERDLKLFELFCSSITGLLEAYSKL